MDPERWLQVEAVVATALELSDEERAAFLEEACGTDHELRAEVEDLLANRTDVEGFLEKAPLPSAGGDGGDDRASIDPLIGSTFGPYRIERLLGSGGMGAVYLASRADEEYERRVAIKVLHAGMAAEDVVRRFRAERQILAVLDHPNIAAMIDGGSTEDGRPYLVMEYVEGIPLDQYCETHGLPVRERIELFLKVCAAVTFAHRNLVVHRDLKPSNVLVTGDGEPKLLDFGIAKLLDPAAIPGGGEATRTGLRPMSPAFASPEQIRGLPITTASDVYSLGVVLYNLLIGELPRRFKGCSLSAMERELGREPTAPSIAEGAGNSPKAPRIRKQIAGDLDAIVLKALRDEPEHRYSTVDNLAEDLKRHLEGLPVGARRGGFAYRAGRMVRRHKIAAAGTVLAAGLIASFTIVVAAQHRRTAHERDRAERIAGFLISIFEEASPDISGDGAFSSRDVLDRGSKRIDREFADFPETRADLLLTVGQVYAHLGMDREALPLLRHSLELREQLDGEHSLELAKVMNQLSYVLIELGEWEEAKRLLDRALAIGEDKLGVRDEEFIATLQLLGQHHWRRSEPDLAVPYYRRALELREQIHGPGDPKLASAMSELAVGLDDLGEIDESERLLLRAIKIFETADDPNPAELATALNNIGSLYWRTGRLELAADSIERAIKIHERITGPNSAAIGSSLNNLALVQADRGEIEKAAALFRRSLEVKLRGLEETSPAVLATRNNLASVLFEFGNLKEAHAEWSATLQGCRLVFAQDSPRTAGVLRSLATVDHFLGRDRDAKKQLDESMTLLQNGLEENHPSLIQATSVAAQLRLGRGDTAEAERLLRRVVSAGAEDDDSGFMSWRSLAGCRLAEILIASGRLDEAAAQLGRVDETVETHIENDPSPSLNRLSARLHITQGDLHRAHGDETQSRVSWTQAIHVLELTGPGSTGADHRLLRIAALIRLGRRNDALQDAEHLIDLGWQRPEWIRLAVDPDATSPPAPIPVVLY